MSNPEGKRPEFIDQDFADKDKIESLKGQKTRMVKETLGLNVNPEPLPEDFAEQVDHNDQGLIAKAKAEKTVKKMIENIRSKLFPK